MTALSNTALNENQTIGIRTASIVRNSYSGIYRVLARVQLKRLAVTFLASKRFVSLEDLLKG